MSAHTNLESHHDRLGLQRHIPDFFDSLLNLIFEGENFGGAGFAAIDDGERVFIGDTNAAEAVSAGEAGFLDEPSR